MAEDNKNEKLNPEEMDQMAGGNIFGDLSKIFPQDQQYREEKCPWCGSVVRIPMGLYAGIPQCNKCNHILR